MFKVNNRNTGTSCKICFKLTVKTPERRQCRLPGFFIFNLEHISRLPLVLLLLTLNRYLPVEMKLIISESFCNSQFPVSNFVYRKICAIEVCPKSSKQITEQDFSKSSISGNKTLTRHLPLLPLTKFSSSHPCSVRLFGWFWPGKPCLTWPQPIRFQDL